MIIENTTVLSHYIHHLKASELLATFLNFTRAFVASICKVKGMLSQSGPGYERWVDINVVV